MEKVIAFEHAITDLEAIVTQLEKGDLSLEESLKQFESGIKLARECKETLKQAEQKIEYLITENLNSNDTSAI